MLKFKEYASRRFLESLSLSDVRTLILRALGGNIEAEDSGDAKLIQFVPLSDLLGRLQSLPALANLINAKPAAVEAIQKADQSGLTVSQLSNIIASN